ncbi:MAG: fucose isomerase [Bacteroides sp.]|jgi:L-fucose isomerase-like protein|nr:fucose isomerase [Bacteroides sp.]MCI1681983.1 fucose isomerase [Bacteroides sp.]
MVLNLITFASPLHKKTSILQSHELLINELEKYFTVNFIKHQDIGTLTKDDFCLLFIATGGVEGLVAQYFEKLPRPAILLADGIQNSLASALEISSWLRTRGMKSEILHGDPVDIVKRVFILHNNYQAQHVIAKYRIGVIGTPSPWLIASNVDYLLSKRRWGIEYIDISLDKVYKYFHQIKDEEVQEACTTLTNKALAIREASPKDIEKAMRLYYALKKLVQDEHLGAITLNCFKLIENIDTTGCLALSLLNDEGIMAGCEGDLQSIFTQIAVKALTGKASFMANPSMINIHNNEIVLAHCSIGLEQTERYIVRNHFETEKGVSIKGILPTGDVTVVKCGGECLDEYYLSTGTLIENTNYINMCRTQVRIKMDTPSDYFLKNPLGNHHIMLQGNYETVLENFMEANNCKRMR